MSISIRTARSLLRRPAEYHVSNAVDKSMNILSELLCVVAVSSGSAADIAAGAYGSPCLCYRQPSPSNVPSAGSP